MTENLIDLNNTWKWLKPVTVVQEMKYNECDALTLYYFLYNTTWRSGRLMER